MFTCVCGLWGRWVPCVQVGGCLSLGRRIRGCEIRAGVALQHLRCEEGGGHSDGGCLGLVEPFEHIVCLLVPVQMVECWLVRRLHLDVVKCSDYVIDLGPEGGDRGGQIVAQGTPEQIADVEASYTGQFLKSMLKPE